jgi:protein TonB
MSQIYTVKHRTLAFLFASASVMLLRAQSFKPCSPFGGEPAVKTFLEQEMRFPEAELEKGTKGSVFLIFSVMSTGDLRDLRIWRSLTPACDAEALRLGRLVRWHPATVADTPNDAEHYLEVPFDPKRYMRAMEARRCLVDTRTTADTSLNIADHLHVEVQPTPDVPGGMKGLPTYMGANLRYPESAYKRDLQGTVKLDFVVETSGNISNMRATEELGGGCTEEAMRLVRTMCWRPAEKNGQRVRCTQHVEIQFKLVPRDR